MRRRSWGLFMNPSMLSIKFETGMPYEQYVRTGSAEQQHRWKAVYETAELGGAQRELVKGFVRRMNVLVVSGIWCGDCIQQCPLLQRIADANPEVVLVRFL